MRLISTIIALMFSISIINAKGNDKIKNDQDSVYLMSYFKGPNQHLFYAYSTDGIKWIDINDSKPIFKAYDASVWMRDPYLRRVVKDGTSKYHLVHTWGWDNPAIFHWESTDLITWVATNGGKKNEDGRIYVMDGKNGNCKAVNAWAPEFFYENKTETYYIYWSSDTGNGYMKHHYCTTKDWLTFTPSKVYFDPGFTAIDMTIMENDGVYYAYYKDERNGQKRTRLATSTSLNPEIDKFRGTFDLFPHYNLEVEGPEVFKVVEKNQWFMYWDKFMGDLGISFAITDDPSSNNWKLIPDAVTQSPSSVKHGSVEIISKEELNKILNHFEK